jgi:hypothetical protein
MSPYIFWVQTITPGRNGVVDRARTSDPRCLANVSPAAYPEERWTSRFDRR